VKQGDALSCSLFLLSIEPVIRNIIHNDNIRPLTSDRLQFTWPKLLCYADDITVITENNAASVGAVFNEYEKLTQASGLKLNADKTEKFNITSSNVINADDAQNVLYANQRYTLRNQDVIKINGIWYANNRRHMKEINLEHMTAKMNSHFKEWSKRSLSILGKIQIIKTFGMSQYLYTLAVINLDADQWKAVNKLIYKFIWNKNYNVSPAPHRIKKTIMTTEIEKGGFGLVDLELTTKASRLRRFSHLLTTMVHPVSELQLVLGANDPLCSTPILDIDDITTSTMKTVADHNLRSILNLSNYIEATDVEMNHILLNSNIRNLVKNLRSRELTILRHRQIVKLYQALRAPDNSSDLLFAICKPYLVRHIRALQNRPDILYSHVDERRTPTLYSEVRHTSIQLSSLTSRQIRINLHNNELLTTNKMLTIADEQATRLYKCIQKVACIQNKNKLLRLIHGDVYCGNRLKKFDLSNNDRCVRCFEEETRHHLLIDCTYTKAIWNLLELRPQTLYDLIGNLNQVELEVMADIISEVMFRKKVLPPTILLKTIFVSYANGKCRRSAVTRYAQTKVSIYNNTGSWHS